MEKLIFVLLILAISASEFSAQNNPPSTSSQRDATARRDALERQQRDAQIKNDKAGWQFETLRNPVLKNSRIDLRADIPKILGPNEDLISIDASDRERFETFLKDSDTGIVRLYDLTLCQELNCPKPIIVGATSYSFRSNGYRPRPISDLAFENSSFRLVGINTLGFITELGDVPIESVDSKSDGVFEMAGFEPSAIIEDVEKQHALAMAGFAIGEYTYKTSLRVKEQTTYGLRSIAYAADLPKVLSPAARSLLLSEEKRDSLIVFRVVRRHGNGSTTLIWKILSSKDAPKLEFRAPAKPELKKN